jgi:anti-anti-sigma regulatory factor
VDIRLVEDARAWVLTLSGVAGIADANALATAARTIVDGAGGDVVVKLGELRGLDTSATQVLLSLRRSLATQRRALRLEAVPAAIAERWQRAGLLELVDPAPARG